MIEVIKGKLQQIIEKKVAEEGGRLRLSQLHTCLRYQHYAFLEGIPEPDLVTKGHYLKGLVWERFLFFSVFTDAKYQYEVELNGIKGHIDFFYPPNVAIEVKATNTTSIPFLPQFEHIQQVKNYLAALKNQVADPLGLILYIIVDNPALSFNHIYPVEISNEEFLTISERAIQLRQGIFTEEPLYEPDKLPCMGLYFGKPYKCTFWDKCHKVQAIMPTDWVDEAGFSIEKWTTTQETLKRNWTLKRKVETMLKDYLKKNPETQAIEIEGADWKVIAQREKPKEVFIQGAKDKLIEILGYDFIKPYLRTLQSFKVVWQKKTGEAFSDNLEE